MLDSLDLSSIQVDLLNAIAFELSKISGVRAVVLGGSYARRTARPDSDLDVGLYYSKNSPPDIEAIRRCAETIVLLQSLFALNVEYYFGDKRQSRSGQSLSPAAASFFQPAPGFTGHADANTARP